MGNGYAYVANNPQTFVDPFGLSTPLSLLPRIFEDAAIPISGAAEDIGNGALGTAAGFGDSVVIESGVGNVSVGDAAIHPIRTAGNAINNIKDMANNPGKILPGIVNAASDRYIPSENDTAYERGFRLGNGIGDGFKAFCGSKIVEGLLCKIFSKLPNIQEVEAFNKAAEELTMGMSRLDVESTPRKKMPATIIGGHSTDTGASAFGQSAGHVGLYKNQCAEMDVWAQVGGDPKKK